MLLWLLFTLLAEYSAGRTIDRVPITLSEKKVFPTKVTKLCVVYQVLKPQFLSGYTQRDKPIITFLEIPILLSFISDV